MLTYKEAMKEIESIEFDVIANVSGGTGVFKGGLVKTSPYKILSQAVNSETIQDKIYERAIQLIGDSGDKEFEHPHDVALAAYVMLLKDKPQLPALKIELAKVNNLWWAKKVNEGVAQ